MKIPPEFDFMDEIADGLMREAHLRRLEAGCDDLIRRADDPEVREAILKMRLDLRGPSKL